MPEPLILPCPCCKCLVKLPEEYLGKIVTCLECKKAFTAPIRNETGLTEATPLPPATISPKAIVPLFGLLLIGASSLMINAYCYYRFQTDPNSAKDYVRQVLHQIALTTPPEEAPPAGAAAAAEKKGKVAPPTEAEKARMEERQKQFLEEQDRLIEQRADELAPHLLPLRKMGLASSSLVLLAGFAFALHRGYWIAFAGCLIAVINTPDMGCCFPGAIVGIWGFFFLVSDTGRSYFGKF